MTENHWKSPPTLAFHGIMQSHPLQWTQNSPIISGRKCRAHFEIRNQFPSEFNSPNYLQRQQNGDPNPGSENRTCHGCRFADRTNGYKIHVLVGGHRTLKRRQPSLHLSLSHVSVGPGAATTTATCQIHFHIRAPAALLQSCT